MTRSVPEWIGKTPDTKVPDRVRLRVFEAYGGRCYLSGIKIAGKSWQMDHKIALSNWAGEGHGNRESNLAPALEAAHKAKTCADVKEKAHNARIRKKHAGIKKPSTFANARDGKYKTKVGGGTVLRKG